MADKIRVLRRQHLVLLCVAVIVAASSFGWLYLQSKKAVAYYIGDSSLSSVTQSQGGDNCLETLADSHRLIRKDGGASIIIHEHWNETFRLDSGKYRRLSIGISNVEFGQKLDLPSSNVQVSYSSGGTAWLNKCIESDTEAVSGFVVLNEEQAGTMTVEIAIHAGSEELFTGVYELTKQEIGEGNRFS